NKRIKGVFVLFRQLLAAGEGAAAAGRDVGVLRHPQRLEATALGLASQLVDADRVLGGEDADADVHGHLLLRLRGEGKVRVRGEPAAVAANERGGAPPGAAERGAIGSRA